MTTYKKLTWDSYKIQVESAVRDGNGATISTTYATKTEVTTGLGTKLDTTVAASTYATQTALTDGLAAKADKATSLAGYGITDGVTTNTAQTITEVKTFTHPNGAIILKRNEAYSSGQVWSPYLEFKTDTGDVAVGRLYARRDSSNMGNMVIDVRDPNSGDWKGSFTLACNSSDAWMTVPYRAYNAANVNDVVTIGSLAANPSVIHATGNETINGIKTFTAPISERGASPSVALYSTSISSSSVPDTSMAVRIFDNNSTQVGTFEQRYFGTTQSWIRLLTYHVGNGTDRAELRVTFEGTTAKLVLLKRLSGTETSTTIATL